MLELNFYPEIHTDSKVVLPISMTNPAFTFDVISHILDHLKEHAVTVLVCDYLNRHNVGEEQALRQGDAFLEKHQTLFTANVEVIRWQAWIEAHQSAYNVSFKKIMELSGDGSDLQRAMLKTARQRKNKVTREDDIAASLKYQREEYAVIDCMKEYDQLIYIALITHGMGVFYKYAEITCPQYVHCKVKKMNASLQALRAEELGEKLLTTGSDPSNGFFSPVIEKKLQYSQLSIGTRVILQGLEELMFSTQVSKEEKKVLISLLKRLVYYGETQFTPEVKSQKDRIVNTKNSNITSS